MTRTFRGALGRAAMDVGATCRAIQEALFEVAMKGQDAERDELARVLHERHPRTLYPPRRDFEGERSACRLTHRGRKGMALPQSLEPISNAVNLSIDMQNLFAPGGIWATPWMERVLPAIVAVAEL